MDKKAKGLPRWPYWQVIHLLTQETQETWVRSLSREGPLEKEMATHSSIFAWKIPWAEEPGGLKSKGPQRVRHDRILSTKKGKKV